MMRKVTIVILIALLSIPAYADSLPPADEIIVKKAKRRLYLLKDGYILRGFSISLGENPVGHKQREGDKKTPEGRYHICGRNPNSSFYLSLQISYPDEADIRSAIKRGVDPGGMIMIHGLPNELGRDDRNYINRDWTDGCIAVANRDMDEIWNAVRDGTPIVIFP